MSNGDEHLQPMEVRMVIFIRVIHRSLPKLESRRQNGAPDDATAVYVESRYK
jgi:hypothetical protein